MWDVIAILGATALVLFAQLDVFSLYDGMITVEGDTGKEKYGILQEYPEVTDFVCPTCRRHFSSYDHCHRHAELRNHNRSSIFCEYSLHGLPKCERSARLVFEWFC